MSGDDQALSTLATESAISTSTSAMAGSSSEPTHQCNNSGVSRRNAAYISKEPALYEYGNHLLRTRSCGAGRTGLRVHRSNNPNTGRIGFAWEEGACRERALEHARIDNRCTDNGRWENRRWGHGRAAEGDRARAGRPGARRRSRPSSDQATAATRATAELPVIAVPGHETTPSTPSPLPHQSSMSQSSLREVGTRVRESPALASFNRPHTDSSTSCTSAELKTTLRGQTCRLETLDDREVGDSHRRVVVLFHATLGGDYAAADVNGVLKDGDR